MARIAFCAVIVLLLDLMLAVCAAEDHRHIYKSPEAWRRAVPTKYQRRLEYAFVEADSELPNVLLIGGSISMSYTVGVREKLAGIANVYRAPDNCRSTRQTLGELETYLGEVRWDVIHFNWGIHDLTHLDVSGKAAPPPDGKAQVPLDQYDTNLRELLRRLRQTDARLIWASTTPVGRKAEVKGCRRDIDVIAPMGRRVNNSFGSVPRLRPARRRIPGTQ